MTTRSFCDGLTRRDFLRLGTAGLFGLGLTLPRLLELQAAAPPQQAPRTCRSSSSSCTAG